MADNLKREMLDWKEYTEKLRGPEREFVLENRTDVMDHNEESSRRTGNAAIAWSLISNGRFPEWVLEYLQDSAKELFKDPLSAQSVMECLKIKQADFGKYRDSEIKDLICALIRVEQRKNGTNIDKCYEMAADEFGISKRTASRYWKEQQKKLE